MRPLAAIAACALALAACGGDDDGDGGAPAAGGGCPDGAVVITMKDITFQPAEATAKVGQEICWPNEDEVQHDAVAEEGADFKSELYGKGESFTATVDEPGTVKYVCSVHPGMDGTIEVTP